jgi:hypothetical protein
MEDHIPDDLRPDISATVTPILESIRNGGGHVSIIHWASKADRTVAYSSKTGAGIHGHTLCGEADLAERLRSLLKASSEATTSNYEGAREVSVAVVPTHQQSASESMPSK